MAQSQETSLVRAVVTVSPSPVYDVFGSGRANVQVDIFGASSFVFQPGEVDVVTTVKESSLLGIFEIDGVNTSLSGSPKVTGPVNTYAFDIPPNATSFHLQVQGSESVYAFLWRDLVGLPSLSVQSQVLTVNYYTYQIAIPSGSLVSQEYSGSQGIPVAYTVVSRINGTEVLNLQTFPSLVILQSTLFLPATLVVTSAALTLLAFAALNLFGRGRMLLGRLWGPLRSFSPLRREKGTSGGGRGLSIRKLFLPRKLLVVFVLCALVMVAFSALGGPDPRIKAYVISDPAGASQIQSELQQSFGNTVVITPSQDYTDFAVMASVGQFQMVVVSGYSSTSQISNYIIGGLGDVPVIVIDQHADPTFTGQVTSLYSNKVVTVSNAANLSILETKNINFFLQTSARPNLLGLHLSTTGFDLLLVIEGLLSFALVFTGWAYLGSLVTKDPAVSDLSHALSVAGTCIFVFVLTEAIYIEVSSLLAYPISLHAVTSGAHSVTVVGLLGLGGGSTPRLATGVLGVVVGALATPNGLKIKWPDFVLILALMLFLLANPLALGQYAFQGLLLFVPLGNFAFGTAYSNLISIKGFLYGVGSVLGGGVTPSYLLSAGKILFFAGIIPLAYLRKLAPTTAAFALLLVAFIVGDGGVRVGEMTPLKTFASIVPGLVAGFVIALLLLGLSYVESRVRGS
jgi:hypothetical protein